MGGFWLDVLVIYVMSISISTMPEDVNKEAMVVMVMAFAVSSLLPLCYSTMTI